MEGTAYADGFLACVHELPGHIKGLSAYFVGPSCIVSRQRQVRRDMQRIHIGKGWRGKERERGRKRQREGERERKEKEKGVPEVRDDAREVSCLVLIEGLAIVPGRHVRKEKEKRKREGEKPGGRGKEGESKRSGEGEKKGERE
jgi:hypothetical protein